MPRHPARARSSREGSGRVLWQPPPATEPGSSPVPVVPVVSWGPVPFPVVPVAPVVPVPPVEPVELVEPLPPVVEELVGLATFQGQLAGVGSTLPAASLALALSSWGPLPRLLRTYWPWLSTEQAAKDRDAARW